MLRPAPFVSHKTASSHHGILGMMLVDACGRVIGMGARSALQEDRQSLKPGHFVL